MAALVLACAAVGASAAESHEHGSAELELAVEGSDVLMHFASPLHNLVGFEHAPRDDRDREAIAAARVLLDDPGNLVQLRADAGCAVVELDVDWDAPSEEEQEYGHGEAEDDHDEEEHADVTVAIRYRCDHPDRLNALAITAFESFERLSEVELRAVGPGGAVAESPERGSPRVDLRSLFER